MGLKFGASSSEDIPAITKKPFNHYKWISMFLGLCVVSAALAGVYELTVRQAFQEKIDRQFKVITDGGVEREGLRQQLKDLTIANDKVISDLKLDNETKIAAFAQQAASCDAIKKRYGFK